MRPSETRSPTTPLNRAGMRTEPPMSLPWAIGPIPVATAAPAPPLRPPRREGRIARVQGAPVQCVVGKDAHREGRGVGPPDDHCSRPPEIGDDRAVSSRDIVAEGDG